VNNTELTVVGVAQAGFTGIQVGQSADIFVPLMMKAANEPERNGLEEWNNYWLAVFARRKPGLSIRKRKRHQCRRIAHLLQEQAWADKKLGTGETAKFLDKQILLVFWSERSNHTAA